MISMKLIVYCVLAAGAYLLVVSIALQLLENKLHLSKPIPAKLLEKPAVGWFIINYVTELLFYVVIPSLAYSLFYVVLPLSGVRAGMAVALVAFTLGGAAFDGSFDARATTHDISAVRAGEFSN